MQYTNLQIGSFKEKWPAMCQSGEGWGGISPQENLETDPGFVKVALKADLISIHLPEEYRFNSEWEGYRN